MNLASIIDDHPADAVALISRRDPTTYGRLREQVAGIRGGLVGAGIQPDDRVAIVAANNWYFVVSYLATLGIGAVAVPLNPTSPAPELSREIAGIGARAVIVGPTARRTFEAVDRRQIPTVETVIGTASGPVADALVLDDLLGSEPAPIVPRQPGDLAVLMFTSGTAGSPKAAMLSHGNLLSNIEQAQAHPHRAQGPDDISLGVLPFFHIFGLNVVLGLSLHAGGTVLAIERFDPYSCVEAIQNHGVTLIAGAPAMWSAWAMLPDVDPDAFSSVRIAGSGAAKLPVEVAERFEQRFGVRISEGYGLTEASPVVTNATGMDAPFGSIGAPLPGIRLRLVDTDDSDVYVGDAGELLVQGPNVFQGYWQDPEATRDALTDDGWLRTGDLAVVDDDGFLYLVDRKKDLIIVSGFNVYPGEVEQVLVEHPDVAAAAVVGVPHPHTGEAVKAFVVVEANGHVEEDELIHHCEERLARYKCPHKVLFVDEIPHGLGGKVLRRQLS